MSEEILTYNNTFPTVGGYGLTMPEQVTPSEFRYEPLGVSGVMYAPTATGEGASFSGEGLSANAALVSANGNEIRLSGGTLFFTPQLQLYNIWKDKRPYPVPYMDVFGGEFPYDCYDIQPLILSADIKVNKVNSNANFGFGAHGNWNDASNRKSVNLFNSSYTISSRIPITDYGYTVTPYNGAFTANGHVWASGDSRQWFNWTWLNNMNNHEGTAYINHEKKASMAFRAQWSGISAISAINCDVTIRDLKLVYFSYTRANYVKNWWGSQSQYAPDNPAFSAYYPSGVMPDYISARAPVINP